MSSLIMKHISMGIKDPGLWGVAKADGTVCRVYGDAGYVGWVPDKVGKAAVIAAVDYSNAWTVNNAGEIWQVVMKPSLDQGGTWAKVPTHSGKADAATIAVGADGSVWYAQKDGLLFVREKNSWQKPKQDQEGRASVLAPISKTEVWSVNKDHEIWHLRTGKWTKVQTHSGKADAKTIAAGSDKSVWYAQTDGKLFRRENSTWKQDPIGNLDVVTVYNKNQVSGINSKSEIWSLYDGKWQQFLEIGPDERIWTYKVKRGDGLMAIVRKEFNLKDPQDTQEINRLVDLIVAQNKHKYPTITRDRINAGWSLEMRY